jgi:hypothetical protein
MWVELWVSFSGIQRMTTLVVSKLLLLSIFVLLLHGPVVMQL